MYWLLSRHHDQTSMDRERSMLELPPVGYTGSLKGTSWDDSAMLAGYRQG